MVEVWSVPSLHWFGLHSSFLRKREVGQFQDGIINIRMSTNLTHESRASCDYCTSVISLLLLCTVGGIVMLCSCSAGYTCPVERREITVGVSHAALRSRAPFSVSNFNGWGADIMRIARQYNLLLHNSRDLSFSLVLLLYKHVLQLIWVINHPSTRNTASTSSKKMTGGRF